MYPQLGGRERQTNVGHLLDFFFFFNSIFYPNPCNGATQSLHEFFFHNSPKDVKFGENTKTAPPWLMSTVSSTTSLNSSSKPHIFAPFLIRCQAQSFCLKTPHIFFHSPTYSLPLLELCSETESRSCLLQSPIHPSPLISNS